MRREGDHVASDANASRSQPVGCRLARIGIDREAYPINANDDEAACDLVGDLAAAIAWDELSLFVQPIIDPATGLLTGYEVLPCWFHPSAGQIGPERVMAIAQAGGFAERLTFAVLAKAVVAAAQWPDETFVMVTVCPSCIGRQRVADAILQIVGAADLAPDRLVLAITEPACTVAPAAKTMIQLLRAAGIGFAGSLSHRRGGLLASSQRHHHRRPCC